MSSLYIHIPFCKRKCLYCDFYSCGVKIVNPDEYVEVLLKEMRVRNGELNKPLETLYIGGGTPSLLSASLIYKILNEADKIFGIKPDAEITMEVNPDDLSDIYCKELKGIGINRVSAGIQSLNDAELKKVGRRHNSTGAKRAMELLSKVFDNCSFDIIYGLPLQTLDTWLNTLTEVLKFRPKHLSAYSLMYEEGTPLIRLKETGQILEAPDDMIIEFFDTLVNLTEQMGYSHYEISNFALPGFESRHNSSYWQSKPYLGLGPSAHSYDGDLVRRWNPADLKKYMNWEWESGENFYEKEILNPTEKHEEYLLTRLRTREGINIEEYKKMFGKEMYFNLLKKVKSYNDPDALCISNNNISISRKGILTSDAIIVSLF